MSAAQSVFLLAFGFVILAILMAVYVVLREARRIDGGAHWNGSLLIRLGRLPAERSEANRLAFYVHRLTGIGIFAFLALHIVDVSLYALSHQLYNNVHQLYGTAIMRVFECGLLFALLFHALNGLRLIAIDIWDVGAGTATRLLTGVSIATLTLTVAGSVVILGPVFT